MPEPVPRGLQSKQSAWNAAHTSAKPLQIAPVTPVRYGRIGHFKKTPLTHRQKQMETKMNDIENLKTDKLHVGKYLITPFGSYGDFWIEHESGEGIQVRKIAFEKLISEFYGVMF